MKTPEQLKGAVRNIARKKELHPQEVMQMYFFERIIERLSKSAYKDNFILKGGLLISSMIGIAERTTLDMDTTVRGIRMDEERIRDIVGEIIHMDVGDGIRFEQKKIEAIREDDEYNNFRVHLQAVYGGMNTPMKLDITTGDKITPAAIRYSYQMMFEDREVEVMAYALETILAEKYETIIRRNIGNTRARDFYDLYILFRSRKEEIRRELFKLAVQHTAAKRGSLVEIGEYKEICEEIRTEPNLELIWKKYAKQNTYASELSYEDVARNVFEVGVYLNE